MYSYIIESEALKTKNNIVRPKCCIVRDISNVFLRFLSDYTDRVAAQRRRWNEIDFHDRFRRRVLYDFYTLRTRIR